MGYSRAGFEVVGVDIEPQPHYPFEFVQADAMALLRNRGTGWRAHGRFLDIRDFDVVHTSPPCPRYAPVTKWRGDPETHPDYLPEVREALTHGHAAWVIENVPGAPMRPDYVLCGSMFGLAIRRHRYFETSWGGYQLVQPCRHRSDDLPFEHKNERAYADALGCPWMTAREGRDAIPPAYTEFIGSELLEHLRSVAA